MSEWKTDFQKISICYTDHWAKIKTDSHLFEYLNQEGNGSLAIGEHILKTYKQIMGKELKISRESLSVEILVHAYLDVIARDIETIAKLLPPKVETMLKELMQSIEGHTEIIDCGELEVDTNRHIFDSLVPYNKFLYLLLGKHC